MSVKGQSEHERCYRVIKIHGIFNNLTSNIIITWTCSSCFL